MFGWKTNYLSVIDMKNVGVRDLFFVLLYLSAFSALTSALWPRWDGIELMLRRTHFFSGLLLCFLLLFIVRRFLSKAVGRRSAQAFVCAAAFYLFNGLTAVLPLEQLILGTIVILPVWAITAFRLISGQRKRRRLGIRTAEALMLFLMIPGFLIGPALAFNHHPIKIHHISHYFFSVLLFPLLMIYLLRTAPEKVGRVRRNGMRMAGVVVILLAAVSAGTWKNSVLGVEYPIDRLDVWKAEVLDLSLCGTRKCHPAMMREWRASSHRFAGYNRGYNAIRKRFVSTFGPDEAMFCERCHNPIAAYLGLDLTQSIRPNVYQRQGVQCAGCHMIEEVEAGVGNGLIKFREPQTLFPRADRRDPKVRKAVKELIMLSLYEHRNQWDAPHDSEAGCGTCHKATIPTKYTGGKRLVLGDTYTPWVNSDVAREGIMCQSCHAQITEKPYKRLKDHLMPGLNNALPVLIPGQFRVTPEEKLFLKEYTEKAILGDIRFSVIDDFAYYKTGFLKDMGKAMDYLQRSPIQIHIRPNSLVSAGRNLTLFVHSRNVTGAHVIPTGLQDLIDLWLQLEVKDARGKRIFRSGFIDEKGGLDPQTPRLGAELFDEEGRKIIDHTFWRTRSVKAQILAIGQERVDTYEVPVPHDAVLPLRVDVAWNYRRYKPEITSEIFGEDLKFPVLTVSRAYFSVP